MNYLEIPGVTTEELFHQHHITCVSQLACWAAIELDNARLERNDNFTMCHLLARWLRGLADDEQACLSFGAMHIIWPLLKEDDKGERRVPYPHTITHRDHLIIALDHFAAQLERVANHPERYRENDCAGLNAMRDFCLEISKVAGAVEGWRRNSRRFLCAA